jgi:hypothetical protein
MSLTRHISTILTEQISDKKREALYKIFLNIYTTYNEVYLLEKNGEKDNYGNYITANNQSIEPSVMGRYKTFSRDAFKNILNLDQTPNKQYAQWLITKGIKNKYIVPIETYYNVYSKNKTFGIDFSRLNEDRDDIKDLIILHFNKKQSPDFPSHYKDINKINTLDELRTSVEKYLVTVDSHFDNILSRALEKGVIAEDDFDVVYKDNQVQIYVPHTEESACILGAKSNWCTTWGEHSVNKSYKDRRNYFDIHDDEGKIYIFRFINGENNDEFYQIHFPSKQFKDARDNDVDFYEAILEKLNKGATKAFAEYMYDVISLENRWYEFELLSVGNGNYDLKFKSYEHLVSIYSDSPLGFDYTTILDKYDERWMSYYTPFVIYKNLSNENKQKLVDHLQKLPIARKFDLHIDDKEKISYIIKMDDNINNFLSKLHIDVMLQTIHKKEEEKADEKFQNIFGFSIEKLKQNTDGTFTIDSIPTDNIYTIYSMYSLFYIPRYKPITEYQLDDYYMYDLDENSPYDKDVLNELFSENFDEIN